jgi:IS4 transposase
MGHAAGLARSKECDRKSGIAAGLEIAHGRDLTAAADRGAQQRASAFTAEVRI